MRQQCSRSARSTGSFALRSLVLGTVLLYPGFASAGTEIRGPADAMYLRVEDAPLSEVLAALSNEFKLKYPSQQIVDRNLSGTYSGTLRHVLTRILDGSNYVIRFSDEDIEIKVLMSASSTDGVPPSSVAVAVSPRPVGVPNKASTSPQVPPLVPK